MAFIRDLLIEEKFKNCNANVILMKTGSFIKMTDPENYKETNFHTYQRLERKLMYVLCGTKLDIAFVVKHFNRYNTDP